VSPPTAEERRNELLTFALERLPAMRLADGAFCHEIVAPGLEPRGGSLRYTLIVLLGLLRAVEAGLDVPIDPQELKHLLIREIDSPELTPGDLGLLLSVDARSGAELGDRVPRMLERRLGGMGGLGGLEGLEVSWILIGAAAFGADALLEQALTRQLARAQDGSGLFRHLDAGRRSRFPNFATEIYGVLALASVGRSGGHPHALAAARRAADRLLGLQREDGGWPWIYDTRSGRVVEPYEIYTVHQDAMAPMALFELSDATGDPRYREAAVRGLDWVFGRNDLGRSMLDSDVGIIYRSIRRTRPLDRLLLYANTGSSLAGRPLFAGHRGRLELNPTDRPYHLGWLLEAWAGRSLSG
jgi:hypothetical protein